MSSSVLTPAILTTFQDVYIDKLVTALSNISGYSLSLFYVIAGIEIAVFGLVWAVRQEELFGAFFFKVLKLGLIFFLISQYPSVLQAIINGFTQVAFQVSPPGVDKLMFNPAMVWKYGFDHAIQMIQVSVHYGTTNTAMSTLFLWLGFGNVVMFALIGVQVITVVVGFYIVSLVSLLLIPFGGFVGTQSFLTRALRGVLKAGVRVFVVILILGVAVSVWTALPPETISTTTTFDKPLSLFLSALVVWVLIWRLPEIAVDLVGEMNGNVWGSPASTSSSGGGAVDVSTSMASSAVASGTVVSPYGAGGSGQAVSAGASMTGVASGGMGGAAGGMTAAVQVTNTGTSGGGLFGAGNASTVKRSSDVSTTDKKR